MGGGQLVLELGDTAAERVDLVLELERMLSTPAMVFTTMMNTLV